MIKNLMIQTTIKNPPPSSVMINLWNDSLSHIKQLNIQEGIVLSEIDNVYVGDLYGFLSMSGIPKHVHYPILLLNDYSSPVEFKTGDVIKMIDVGTLSKIYEELVNSISL